MITQELIDAVMEKFDDSKLEAKRAAGEPLLSPDEKLFFGAVAVNAKFGSATGEAYNRVLDGTVEGDVLRSFAAFAAVAYIGYAIAKAEAAAAEVPKEAVNA